MITGEIVQIAPSSITAGMPIAIQVTFNAYYPGTYRGTHAEIIAKSGTISGGEAFYSVSEKLQREGEKVLLNGVMPTYPIELSVTLRVREYQTPVTYKWITVDNKVTTIGLPSHLPSVTPKVPPTKPAVTLPYEPVGATFNPVTQTFEFPFGTKAPAIPEEKKTWLWVGAAVVAIAVAALFVRS